jgi:hypothetical protein
MINEIVIRFYSEWLRDLAEPIAHLIKLNTTYKVTIVDHTNIKLEDFNTEDCNPVSIDRHLATKFNIPYVRISRIFNTAGKVVSRRYEVPEDLPPAICIIDTDMVSGTTLRAAAELTSALRTESLLYMTKNQDLIDLEDLVNEISLIDNKYNRGIPGYVTNCTYLINPTFFSERTSLPISLYEPVNTLVGNYNQ